MRARFVDTASGRTRLLHEGSGSPILLIHGVGTSAERWLRNIDALAIGHAVHAPDLFCCGFSSDASFARDLPPLVHLRQLIELCDALALDRVTAIGSSYGGLLAALMAIEHSDRVDRLVVVGSGSALHPPHEQRAVLAAARANATRAAEAGTLEATRERMRRLVHDPASVPEEALLPQLVANALPGRSQASAALLDGLVAALDVPETQSHGRLEKIAAPALLICGREDPRADWRATERAATRIPDCQVSIYERCGHGPMFEQAERFNRDVLRFLAATAAPKKGADACAS